MKKLVSLVLALAMLMSLCAFAHADDVVTIRIWSDNAHEKELRVKQVDEFNNTIGKENGIFIEYTVYGDSYSDSIKTAAHNRLYVEVFRYIFPGPLEVDWLNNSIKSHHDRPTIIMYKVIIIKH